MHLLFLAVAFLYSRLSLAAFFFFGFYAVLAGYCVGHVCNHDHQKGKLGQAGVDQDRDLFCPLKTCREDRGQACLTAVIGLCRR